MFVQAGGMALFRYTRQTINNRGPKPILVPAGYFEHHQHRMHYLKMRAEGWVIGSDMVEESAPKIVLQNPECAGADLVLNGYYRFCCNHEL